METQIKSGGKWQMVFEEVNALCVLSRKVVILKAVNFEYYKSQLENLEVPEEEAKVFLDWLAEQK